jgi:hypothetical protein
MAFCAGTLGAHPPAPPAPPASVNGSSRASRATPPPRRSAPAPGAARLSLVLDRRRRALPKRLRGPIVGPNNVWCRKGPAPSLLVGAPVPPSRPFSPRASGGRTRCASRSGSAPSLVRSEAPGGPEGGCEMLPSACRPKTSGPSTIWPCIAVRSFCADFADRIAVLWPYRTNGWVLLVNPS